MVCKKKKKKSNNILQVGKQTADSITPIQIPPVAMATLAEKNELCIPVCLAEFPIKHKLNVKTEVFADALRTLQSRELLCETLVFA